MNNRIITSVVRQTEWLKAHAAKGCQGEPLLMAKYTIQTVRGDSLIIEFGMFTVVLLKSCE